MSQVIQFEEVADYLAGGKDFIVELGEQTGIGSSSLLVRKCGKTILVDRGIGFEGYGDRKSITLPVGGNLKGMYIDIIIFTHVHADHSALIIPTLLNHPESRVVFSSKTFEELKIVLHDNLVNQNRVVRKAQKLGLPEPEVMFTEQDFIDFIQNTEMGFYEVVDTDEEDVWITWEDWPDWQFGFTFSGHTKGAFMSFVKAPDGDGLIFSGDVCGHDQETTEGVPTISQKFLKDGDFDKCKRIIFVTEATNGNRDREESLEETDARLKADLEKTRDRGGMALFPVFAINRGPNIVAKLVRLGFKVMVAGMVQKTIRAEIKPGLLDKWVADGTVMLLGSSGGREDRQRIIKAAAHGEYGFRPIVTSSATLDQGMSVAFAIEMLPIRENVLVSTGHRFDGSAMKEIFELNNKPLWLGHTTNLNTWDDHHHPIKKSVNFRCAIRHFDYTAHDYRKGLVRRIESLKPDIIFVKHCTEDGFHGLEEALREKIGESCPQIQWARHLNLFEI